MGHFESSPQPPAFSGDFGFDDEEWLQADDANPASSYLPPLQGDMFTSAPYEGFSAPQGLHLTVPDESLFNDRGASSNPPSSVGDGSHFSHSGAGSPGQEEMFASRAADEGPSEIVVGSASSPAQKSTRRGSETKLTNLASRKRVQNREAQTKYREKKAKQFQELTAENESLKSELERLRSQLTRRTWERDMAWSRNRSLVQTLSNMGCVQQIAGGDGFVSQPTDGMEYNEDEYAEGGEIFVQTS
ncbi:hypothetical protein L202_01116 [Cryptococcus amylolentus CBS 6039]|uniref:BZIP domain-containing protein n=2 Tax=Cryptococcus amylolentus TaxID=104669 RepID=A0A1E3I3B4_9TREE|nr:hypothetical protein L202_01116 [Cryptococcus amylolentus CBS 6039]ODN82855.1 hypothetical protein L202_01116 [Cryptococcus amylolentus CBS 6039]ODO10510.1 hypothetical protein I350_01105 [Cryptococcus amylolentus CBS 6273]